MGANVSRLPAPEPYLASGKTSRQGVVMSVKTFPYRGKVYEQPCFAAGSNKALYVRKVAGRNMINQDHTPVIYINGKQIVRLLFWGSFQFPDKSWSSGFPFKGTDGKGSLSKIDPKTGIVVFTKEYIAPDRSKRFFTYTIKPLQGGKAEISWDVGVSPAEMSKIPKKFGVSPWISLKNYRNIPVILDGNEVKQSDTKTLLDKKKVSVYMKGKSIKFNPDNAANGLTVEFDRMVGGSVTEQYFPDKPEMHKFDILFRTGVEAPQGKMIIDFGESMVNKSKYPKVGGIDFWKHDNIHVPLSPTRNLIPNPSFEQDLRYWRFVAGGATYIPGKGRRYMIVDKGLFGGKAMYLSDTQTSSSLLKTFPIPLDKGKTYTLSFYAKSDPGYNLRVALGSAANDGKFKGKYGTVFGDSDSPVANFKTTKDWKRYSRTFTADGLGVQVIVSGRNTMLDGFQLEEGSKPTEFISDPIDGILTTADPENLIPTGNKINAGFTFTGNPGTKGNVDVTVTNAYGETVANEKLQVAIPASGVRKVKLPLDEKKMGQGIFLVRADYQVKDLKYTDYYRFSVMKLLDNTHATKNIYGMITAHISRMGRGGDFAKKIMQWGFGSTSWGVNDDKAGLVKAGLEKKYRITNYINTGLSRELFDQFRHWKEVSPELVKKIEKAAFDKASRYDTKQFRTWSMGNEEHGSYLLRRNKFDEYFKAQLATARGVKKADPSIIFTPTNGTSGYNRLRGYHEIEGFLTAAKKHNFRYDAISVHPYGSTDKGSLSKYDLDEETVRLINQMKRFGYGEETPIFYTEMFNVPETYIPEWNADDAYDRYHSGKLTYDFGNREFIHAATIARIWVICLKYWPRLENTNVWVAKPYLDYHFAPLLMCKVANTFGQLMPDVKFYGDIKPNVRIRGYSFTLKDGTGIAAIWCIDNDVENGRAMAPKITTKFNQPVEFYDMMGNRRTADTDNRGYTGIQLSPMPLFIKAKDVKSLTSSLRSVTSDDVKSNLKVSIQPSVDGGINANIKNLTGRSQRGVIEVSNSKVEYSLAPEKENKLTIPGQAVKVQYGKMYRWDHQYKVKPAKGKAMTDEWKMDFFYVPRTSGMPDWSKIPSIPINNYYPKDKKRGPNDQNASFKIAWDTHNLYLRVDAQDDRFIKFPDEWSKSGSDTRLYMHDGCLEVYFDTGADGRSNLTKGYDNNDYRYDFSIGNNGKSGPGMVYRLREVNHQLADGVNMPTKKEAAEKVKCDFRITGTGYVYTIVFGQRYIEPLTLKKGFISGFGLFLHDKDQNPAKGWKGLSLATEEGSHCDHKPHVWPLMILK